MHWIIHASMGRKEREEASFGAQAKIGSEDPFLHGQQNRNGEVCSDLARSLRKTATEEEGLIEMIKGSCGASECQRWAALHLMRLSLVVCPSRGCALCL